MCSNLTFTSFTRSRRTQNNILVDKNGRAVLADFSLVTFELDQSWSRSLCIDDGAVQWMSPELLDPVKFGAQTKQPTKESDCYALGMVVYQIITGSKPFGEGDRTVIIHRVLDEKRPERPQGESGKFFTDDIWDMLQRCWKTRSGERPSAREILQCLEGDRSIRGGDDNPSDTTSILSQYSASVSSQVYPQSSLPCHRIAG